jgi:DNA-binding CsgD family transcriptional regulator
MVAQHAPTLRGRSSERERLDGLLEDARGGRSAVLVIRGRAGVGKTALMRYVGGQAAAFRILQTSGVESEMELPFAGLHRLCSPLLGRLDTLPAPQQEALRVALGLSSGPPPDRFLVGLATLSLLAEVAEEQPLLCLVDDLQWLDAASGQVLGFFARRLLAEPIAIVFGVRKPSDERLSAGLPELRLQGLGHEDARALLATVVPGRLDERVRDRIIAETRGNPLALLELPRGMSAAELAGGFGGPSPMTVAGIEEAFERLRMAPLPAGTQRLLQLAAADPVGEPLVVWRAAEQLGIDPQAATPAVDAGLLEIGAQVRFRHPCMRSAAYRMAAPDERHALHAALADATDPQLDPDRRAWHRAQATPRPDEQVAAELERSAGRALARGGIAAAAAFLEHAAMLTPDPARRADRLLAAARAKRDAGALDAARELLVAVEAGPVDALQAAQVEQLQGEIAFDQRRVGEAARVLVSAARRFEPLDADLARVTHLEALGAAMWAAGGLLEAAEAARAAPPGPDPPTTVDVLLDAFATRVTEGYAAAVPALRRALEAVLALEFTSDIGRWSWLTGSRAGAVAALELWDADAWHVLAERHVRVARDTGALVRLQFALHFLARSHLLGGDLAEAGRAIEEERAIAEATGTPPVAYTVMTLAAWRGQEELTSELIERGRREASARGIGRIAHFATYSASVLYNGIGRYDAAHDAARQAFEHDHLGYIPFVVPEVAEAASRTGDTGLLHATVERMAERTSVMPTDWALGMDARVRALASEGDAVERLYRESIDRLARTRVRLELARSRLLYGEWLRREGRRVDAREQLRVAREMLLSMGAEGFAERARHELLATGEKVRKRSDDTRDELTPQEEHIARLARDGRTNPEIGAELFLSPRTVEWHLKKVFTKLGISSRRALRDALPREAAAV